MRNRKFKVADSSVLSAHLTFYDGEFYLTGRDLEDGIATKLPILEFTGFQHKGSYVWEGDVFKTLHFIGPGQKKNYLYHEVVWRSTYGQWYLLNLSTRNLDSGSCPLWLQLKNHADDSNIIGNCASNPEILEGI